PELAHSGGVGDFVHPSLREAADAVCSGHDAQTAIRAVEPDSLRQRGLDALAEMEQAGDHTDAKRLSSLLKKHAQTVALERKERAAGEAPEIDAAAMPDVGDDDEVAADIEEDDDEDLAPAKKGSKATERKEVKDLLALGRDKGFLTYDEVNDALPSDIVSSDQIDDVMSMFGDNDIAIVDEANKVKLPETKPPEPEP